MKILITGSTGLLGQVLVSRLTRGRDVVGLSRRAPEGWQVTGPTTGDTSSAAWTVPPRSHGTHVICDLRDADAVCRVVETVKPDLVIHTQAMSDVDHCELHPDEAQAMNVAATRHLCRALAEATVLVAISTDYVFDGAKGRPYDEEDAPRPLSVYGRSKLDAEHVVLRHPRATSCAPSTLFGPARMNFCDRIIRQARQGGAIEAFVDQTTSPTYTVDLADGLEVLVHALTSDRGPTLPPIYHVTNTGACSRLEFAQRVVELLGAPRGLIKPVRMAEQQRPAPRPAYSALTSRHVTEIIGRTLRPWDEALQAYLGRHPIGCRHSLAGGEGTGSVGRSPSVLRHFLGSMDCATSVAWHP